MRVSNETVNTRKIQILEELAKRQTVTIQELADKFKYSSKVAAQNIDRLHQEGLALKVRGGVRSKFIGIKDSAFNCRCVNNTDKKKVIANFIIEKYLVGDHEPKVVVLDAGSTIQVLFRELSLHPQVSEIQLTIVTNNVSVADYACPSNIRLHLTGGRYLYDERCLVGKAAEFFQQFRAKMVFLSASNLSFSGGLLGYNSSECAVKRAMIESADDVFILADDSKFKNTGGELLGKFEWGVGNEGKGLYLELQPGGKKAVKIISNDCPPARKAEILLGFRGTEPDLTDDDLAHSIIFVPYVEERNDME